MTFGESVTLEDLERNIYERLRDEEPVSWVPAVGLVRELEDEDDLLRQTDEAASTRGGRSSRPAPSSGGRASKRACW